ncbi:MAG: hypothetical protein J5844_01965, partial [Clostridia bacterium]|nr:hypothetical protein [Clostridia bacterium]
RYKNRYIFDYRDASYEYVKFYGALVRMLVKNSFFTCISSPKFSDVIKSNKELIMAHNFSGENYKNRALFCEKNKSGKIKIGYVGYLREYGYLARLADVFGKDGRFVFEIHGSGDCVKTLRDYCEKYANVGVFGAYDEKDKMKIVDSFDMICYNYPKNYVNYPALANKFYDGLMRKKPMFANAETFSGELIEREKLGISLFEDAKDAPDEIFNYYTAFDEKEFCENCEKFLEKVIKDDEIYVEAIKKFIRS